MGSSKRDSTMNKSKHPVNNVIWVSVDKIQANDYNPNHVAKKEMELLQLSIESDGFTQPIVVWEREDGIYEVVDGFHRHIVGKTKLGMKELPVVVVRSEEHTSELQSRGHRVC